MDTSETQKLCIILDVVDLSLWHRVFFIHGSHGEHGNFVEGDSTNRKEAVFTYGLFYNKININHCTIDFINNYNYLRCKYTNNNDMFQIFWALFFIMSHDRSMTPSPSVTVWQLTVSKNEFFALQITDNSFGKRYFWGVAWRLEIFGGNLW